MSENDNNENDVPAEGGKLRKLYEESLKANKELAEKLSELESKERVRGVESTLAEKGLNPKLARFVPAEDASDPTRLDTWINDNKDLFSPVGNAESSEPAGGESSVPRESQDAWSRIQKVSENGSHAVTDLAAVEAQMKACQSPAELNALLAQYEMS